MAPRIPGSWKVLLQGKVLWNKEPSVHSDVAINLLLYPAMSILLESPEWRLADQMEWNRANVLGRARKHCLWDPAWTGKNTKRIQRQPASWLTKVERSPNAEACRNKFSRRTHALRASWRANSRVSQKKVHNVSSYKWNKPNQTERIERRTNAAVCFRLCPKQGCLQENLPPAD